MIKTLNNCFLKCADLHDDPSVKIGLMDEWYYANCISMADAIKNDEGLKLIIDVDTFRNLETMCRRLFLIADTIVVRDSVVRSPQDDKPVPIPALDMYHEPYEIDSNADFPLILVPRQREGMWTSSLVKLKNGIVAPLAMKGCSYFPASLYDWILGEGKQLIESGRVVYAPFIPSLKMESELLGHGYSIPQGFNAHSCFSRNYDWLDSNALTSLFNLNVPTVENVDMETLQKIKNDNEEVYKLFSSSMLSALQSIGNDVGTPEWNKEIRYIQKNLIDDNIDKVNTELKKIGNMRTLRALGYAVVLVALNISAPNATTPLMLATEGASILVKEALQHLKDTNQLKKNPSYYLWKVGEALK